MYKRGILLFLLLGIFLITHISALGVGPAKVELNFVPGFEKTIEYKVIGSVYNELELYVKGDLADYITLDKNTLNAGEGFKATIKLPENPPVTPGDNKIYIGVREKIDPELVRGNVATKVAIEVLVLIHVPYPGKYFEIDLKGHDVNVGESVDFLLDIQSRGKEDVEVMPRIDIFSEIDEKIESLYFQSRMVASQDFISLIKTLDTMEYNPGNYRAVAVVNYGEDESIDEDLFRIGSLSINLVGYTNKLYTGKLQKFEVGVESGWNNNIDGAFAKVDIFNETGILTSFETSPATLTPWETKNITGYVDTAGFVPGIYDANITISYFGKERGVSDSHQVKVELIEPKSLLIWYIIGGVGVIMIIALAIIFFVIKKNGRSKKISKKKK